MRPLHLPTLALLMAASACTAIRMPVPAELQSSPEWRVRGRSGWMPNRHLRFGPYETGRVRHGERGVADHTEDRVVGTREGWQEYWFTLRDTADAGSEWTVQCERNDTQKEIDVAGVEITSSSDATMDCGFWEGEADSTTWTLRLDTDRRTDDLAGLLVGEVDRYEIRPTDAPAGLCCEASGYVIVRRGTPVASVERLNDGSVRIAPGVAPDEARLLAATAAALLLHEDLLDAM